MSMQINTLVTHLRPEDAYTLIEFLDQLRDMLLRTHGDEVKVMLQAASQRELWEADIAEKYEAF